MKQLNFLLLITALFYFSSCNEDENLINDLGIEQGMLIAKIDGTEFQSSLATGGIINSIVSDIFMINGPKPVNGNNFEAIILLFTVPTMESVEERNYTFTANQCNQQPGQVCGSISYGTTDNSQSSDLSHSSLGGEGRGSIDITSIDYRPGGFAAGTFEGTVVNDVGETVNVTDGKFNVRIN